MTTLTVVQTAYFSNEGYPTLWIAFAEEIVPEAHISTEANRWINGRGFDVVALGAGFEDLVSWTHPDGRVFRGVTDDSEVVAFTKQFLDDVEQRPELFH